MGIRIHKAVGYGMPMEKFRKLSPLTDIEESLWTITRKTKKLIIPKEEIPEDVFVFQRNLLVVKETYNVHPPKVLKLGKADDLFTIVSGSDTDPENEHVIFYPSAYYAEEWYRWDDTLDYTEAMYGTLKADEDGRYHEAELADKTIYMPYGPYPFTNDIMNLDGTKRAWDHFISLRKDDTWAPRPPFEIRWWTKKLGILDDDGVNQLRPLYAEWWG